MNGTYKENKSANFWDDFFRRREKMLHERQAREYATGVIGLLSQFLSHKKPTTETVSSKSCGYFFNKVNCMPCCYAVSITADILPGKVKKNRIKSKI